MDFGTPLEFRLGHADLLLPNDQDIDDDEDLKDTSSTTLTSVLDTSIMDDESVSSGETPGGAGELVLVRVRVPELNIEKCLQFQKDEVIWEVKQQSLAALPKELQESFNYGLFLPPSNGKAGKFLDEERRLSEYPFPGPIGYLELKYKRRVYKMLHMDEKQLKSINSKASHKKFIEQISNNNVEKVNKMCAKGLDPNFHCQDSGETPLCVAAGLKSNPSKMLISLVNGGAIVDYRAKDGSTALHKSVMRNNAEALRTLLELGASPNYKDGKGLTSLYLCVSHASDVVLCEMLLHDRATVGAQDLQGWQEVHQACRNGLVAHLEQLLFYSADMNARNASGNTPLHVCAVNNQESCARTLLFRGADKEALNFAGQTAYQVAVIAGNLELADVIQRHRNDDIVPFKDAPKFNPRRRMSAASTNTSSGVVGGALTAHSLSPRPSSSTNSSRLESPLVNSLRSGGGPNGGKPPSPSPSDRSLPPFSSGSSVSETSTGSGGSSVVGHGVHGSLLGPAAAHQQHLQHQLLHAQPHQSLLLPNVHEEEQLDSASALAVALTNDSHVESESLSSGVGTSSHSGSAGSATTPTESHPPSLILPGMHVVCLENYSSSDPAGLHITQGDIIEVTGSTDTGMLEGILRGKTGLFPSHCVQEVRLRNPESLKQAITTAPRVAGRREARELLMGNRHFATATRSNNIVVVGEPRTAVLHKGKKGFGFVLRGAKAASPLMEMIPSEKCPGLQYMDDVDPGGVADMAGIVKGDFLLEINGHDVRQASHETVVTLIRKSGDLVSLTVVTVSLETTTSQVPIMLSSSVSGSPAPSGTNSLVMANARQYSTLPRKLQGRSMVQPPPPPKRDPNTTLSVGRAKARSMVANLAAIEALDKAIHEHDSSTSESVTDSVDSVQRMPDLVESSSSKTEQKKIGDNATLNGPPSYRMTAAEVEELINERFAASGDVAKSKVYASVAEMKRSKGAIKSKSTDSESCPTVINGVLIHKDFHSTPDLKADNLLAMSNCGSTFTFNHIMKKPSSFDNIIDFNSSGGGGKSAKTDVDLLMHHHNGADGKVGDQRGYFTLPSRHKKGLEDGSGSYRSVSRIRPVQTKRKSSPVKSPSVPVAPPPPEHPPPPPPVSQVVAVDTNSSSDYAKANNKINNSTEDDVQRSPGGTVMSSFKPSDNAKLYASPEDIQPVAYRSPPPVVQHEQQQPLAKKKSPTRANSMPPRPTRPQVLRRATSTNTSSETSSSTSSSETYNINGISYTTYTTFRSPITPEDAEGPVSGRQFFDPDLTPTASMERFPSSSEEQRPVIPEPDYDVSDNGSDYGSMSRSMIVTSNSSGNNNGCQPGSRTLERKKKKSVSFVMNEEVAAKLQAGRTTRQESILKDPSRDREKQQQQPQPTHCQHGRPISSSSPFANEKYVQPIEKLPLVRLKPQQQQQQQQQPQVLKTVVKVSDQDKIRIEVPPEVPVKAVLSRSNSAVGGSSNNNVLVTSSTKTSLHKSQSFCADKLTTTMSAAAPNNNTDTVMSNGGGISENDIIKARSQLKPSRSFPNEMNKKQDKNNSGGDMKNEEGDNSSSGVSSDQENNQNGNQQTTKFVTYLPVDSSTPSTVQVRAAGGGNWDNASESSDDVSEKSWILRSEQDSMGRNIVSMKKMLHPKLQAIFDIPTHGSDSSSSSPPSSLSPQPSSKKLDSLSSSASSASSTSARHKSYSSQTLPHQNSNRHNSNKSNNKHHGDERSIAESLALIHQHVNSLGEVNVLAGVKDTKEQPEVLAPPPGFSDSESFSDNDSLSSSGSQRRFGIRGIQRSNTTANTTTAQPLTDQLRKERQQGKIMTRSIDGFIDPASSSKPKVANNKPVDIMSRSMDYKDYKDHFYGTLTKKQLVQQQQQQNNVADGSSLAKEFRTKPLMGWTTSDVCDWLDSLFLPEYKPAFIRAEVDGLKLASLTKSELESLGVIRVGHMLNIEKSLKRYLAVQI